jgi:hypothetical protein
MVKQTAILQILPNNGPPSGILFASSTEYNLAIERVASYGMAVGKEVFETCEWVGRFDEAWHATSGRNASLIYRRDVKLHLCQSARAKDANIRQALIDRFGAPGTKKAPGVTYGIKSHLWAAFALAVFAHDTLNPSTLTTKST